MGGEWWPKLGKGGLKIDLNAIRKHPKGRESDKWHVVFYTFTCLCLGLGVHLHKRHHCDFENYSSN